MKKLILFLIFFVSSKYLVNAKNITNKFSNNNQSLVKRALRFGIKTEAGPSIASILLTKRLQKKIKSSLIKKLNFPIKTKFSVSSLIPFNFEIFVGYKPIKWVAFELCFHVNKNTGISIDLELERLILNNNELNLINSNITQQNIIDKIIKKLQTYNQNTSININSKFRHIGFIMKTLFFQGGFYEGLGIRLKYLTHGSLKSKTNIKVKQAITEIENAIKENDNYISDDKKKKINSYQNKLKKLFGTKYKGFNKDILKSKNISNWSLSGIIYLGYEFFFGLIIESSLEINFDLFKALNIKNKIEANSSYNIEDILSIKNNDFIKTIESLSQPIFNISIGYNFSKLF